MSYHWNVFNGDLNYKNNNKYKNSIDNNPSSDFNSPLMDQASPLKELSSLSFKEAYMRHSVV